MKKRGICLLPDACYLSELNVPAKPNRTNLGECAAIQRFLSTHPNENVRPDRSKGIYKVAEAVIPM